MSRNQLDSWHRCHHLVLPVTSLQCRVAISHCALARAEVLPGAEMLLRVVSCLTVYLKWEKAS